MERKSSSCCANDQHKPPWENVVMTLPIWEDICKEIDSMANFRLKLIIVWEIFSPFFRDDNSFLFHSFTSYIISFVGWKKSHSSSHKGSSWWDRYDSCDNWAFCVLHFLRFLTVFWSFKVFTLFPVLHHHLFFYFFKLSLCKNCWWKFIHCLWAVDGVDSEETWREIRREVSVS